MYKRQSTDFSKVSKPVICIKHFREECIIRTEQFIVDGEIKTFTRSYPKPKPDAVPSIFPNLPAYLTTAGPTCRRLCDVESDNFKKAVAESLEDYRQYEEQNALNNLRDAFNYLQVPVTSISNSGLVLSVNRRWCCVSLMSVEKYLTFLLQ